jgi:hypothetical protein
MEIQLTQGEFDAKEAVDLLAQLTQIKIKYHESKINSQGNEEDIKNGEAKIKRLQKELFDLSKNVNSNNKTLKIEAIIKIE